MNLGELRQIVFDQLDWAPTASAEAIARFNRFVQRATDILCLEAPFLFFETELHFATEADVIPSLATDTLTLTATLNNLPLTVAVAPLQEAWVFEADLPVGTAGAVVWPVDRSWDGRQIEIQDANGVYHRNRIRTIQTVQDTTVRISVEKPWDFTTFGVGPFNFRVYTTEYALPDDTIAINSLRFYDEAQNYPLAAMTQDQAESVAYELPRAQTSSGIPRYFYRRKHRKIEGPARPPVAASALTAALGPPNTYWLGPEPPGSFQYKLTYTWGKRDVEFRNVGLSFFAGNEAPWLHTTDFNFALNATGVAEAGTNRGREARYESAPSPASATVANGIVAQANDRTAIKVNIPDIEYALGFSMKGRIWDGAASSAWERTSHGMSGWHVRIWRRRLTVDWDKYTTQDDAATPGGQTVDTLEVGQTLEFKDDFYLLAEMKIDDGNDGVFYDRGELVPDYNRRLRDVHGYETIQFYPLPDNRYEADLRIVRRPQKLVDESDTIEVHAEALEAFICRVTAIAYEAEGNSAKKKDSLKDYEHHLKTVKKRYGLVIPASQVTLKRPGRAFRRRRAHSHRWWRSDT